ncbi:MAG: hypothetical protein L0387_37055, partial [Acidobacteria bacterium]|nr:hypothetical protein [Acidobacteriota bacterium]
SAARQEPRMARLLTGSGENGGGGFNGRAKPFRTSGGKAAPKPAIFHSSPVWHEKACHSSTC